MVKKIFHYVERAIVLALKVMMLLVVALSTVELATTLFKEIAQTGEKAVATGSVSESAFRNLNQPPQTRLNLVTEVMTTPITILRSSWISTTC